MSTTVVAGTQALQQWAQRRGLHFVPLPPRAWFEAWEPFDTLVAPEHYVNACTWPIAPGEVTVVEPWSEEELGAEPLVRSLFAFVKHPRLRHRVSIRAGEHFVSRLSVVGQKPPPAVTLGDPDWDAHVATQAWSAAEAQRGLTGALRRLLREQGFSGHLELRPGGAVVHIAGLGPHAQHYERLLTIAPRIVDAALR
ncbi:MAG: hypothetical protein AAGA56_13425 [Myxococcota bacterium]